MRRCRTEVSCPGGLNAVGPTPNKREQLTDSRMRAWPLGRRGELHRAGRGRSLVAAVLVVTVTVLAIVVVMATGTSREAGAASAPNKPPPKAEVIDGVPLVRATASQRHECQKFANYLKRAIPCPGLLPDPIPDTSASAAGLCIGEVGAFGEGSCGPAAIDVSRKLFELSQSNFQVSSSYVGVTFVQSQWSGSTGNFNQRWTARTLCLYVWDRFAGRHDAQAW